MKQRSFRRVNCHVEITVTAEDLMFKAAVENMSMGGLFARSYKPVSVAEGDIFEITVPLPAGPGNDRVVINGMAIRVAENGIAFRFLETDQETLRALFSFISLR